MTALTVGTKVRFSSNLWTPHGWKPVVEDAVIVDPCVANDPDYAGKIEIKIEGWENPHFVTRNEIEVVSDE